MTSGYPAPGELMGPFQIGRRLGIGGMGIVFEAVDTALGRPVALKIISPHIGEDEGFRTRFIHEAKAQASLDSPHVVQVYSFGDADGQLYIASQLIPDGDLGQMLHKHGAPPPRTGVDLIAQVADGLADAHAAGLVHRDIKPANVLLRKRDKDLQAYLADFGIARQLDAEQGLTVVGGTVGTPTYMAPELHTGGAAGPLSDIYALGCLLWATVSGAAPYVASSDYLVVKGHLESAIPQVAETSPVALELNRVLRTALAKDPSQRYPTATAMRDDLRAILTLPGDQTPISVPLRAGVSVPPPTQQVWTGPTPTPTPWPSAQPVRATGAHPAASSTDRGLWWLLAGGIVVAMALVVLIVVLATRGGSSGSGSPAGSGASDDARRTTAIDAISAGYLTNFGPFGLTDDQSRCIATEMVDGVGVDPIVRAGILDQDLGFHTVDISGDTQVDGAFRSAVVDCASNVDGMTG